MRKAHVLRQVVDVKDVQVHRRWAGVPELVRLGNACASRARQARARGDVRSFQGLLDYGERFAAAAVAGGGYILCTGRPERVAVNPCGDAKPGGEKPWDCPRTWCWCWATGHEGGPLHLFHLWQPEDGPAIASQLTRPTPPLTGEILGPDGTAYRSDS